MSDRMPKYISDRTRNNAFEYMADRTSDRMSGYVLRDLFSEYMPDRMSEYIHVKQIVGLVDDGWPESEQEHSHKCRYDFQKKK